MNAYLTALSKYAVFQGRARRSEYWLFSLVNALIAAVLWVIALNSDSGVILYLLYALAVLLPTMAVGARRLHDTNRSGWWQLLVIVPFGAIVLLVFYCQDGTAGANRFGEDPKGR
jgi:uncharacterized membrane protein YhaH (DUF805 family)